MQLCFYRLFIVLLSERDNDAVHITPLLRQLHWLKAAERIAFKQSVLVYKCLHESTPAVHTLLASFVRWQMSRLVSDSVPVHLHH